MIIAGLSILFFASIFWGLLYLVMKGKKNKYPEEFCNANVLGYGDAARYTDLIVHFFLDGESITVDTDVVDRFDFPVGSEVRISFHRDNLGKRLTLFGDSDKRSGFVRIATPKYIESRRKDLRNTKLLFAVIAISLTAVSIIFITLGL
ncbi:hypothetical protein [Lachnoclostridium sp.]|uniref:hypothetical protein n=1 Tax=Lachnoclostridium sp. TaxID=2028282 RepID=UPI002898D9A1|nr:hypothetical protein [Lachnoclostridium sp.]